MSKQCTRDYSGKEVFMGIDVHKRTYSLVAVCNGVVVKKGLLIIHLGALSLISALILL